MRCSPRQHRLTHSCTDEVVGTHVLMAVGRTPNTSDLGLDRAGVATDHRSYIMVDDQLQTNMPGIWALGNSNGRGAFTHTSYTDYEIAGDNFFNADDRRVSDRIQTYALYIDPPLGRCGMMDAEIRKSGLRALVAKYPMSQVSWAYEKGETRLVIFSRSSITWFAAAFGSAAATAGPTTSATAAWTMFSRAAAM